MVKMILKRLSFVGVVLLALCLIAFFALPLPGQVPVLMYHFIGNEKDATESKNFVSRKSFEKHLSFLKRFGYRVISLEDYADILEGKRKPVGREIAITFDDGNYTFALEAVPILKSYEYPVTVFVVSESIRREIHGSMDQPTLQKLLKYNWIQLGAHSKTHPFLTELNAEKQRDEILNAKSDLEKMFGIKIHSMAYPYGHFNESVMAETQKAGYRLAFTTSHKKLRGLPETRFSKTRIKMTRSADHPLVLWAKVSGLYHALKSLRYQIQQFFDSKLSEA